MPDVNGPYAWRHGDGDNDILRKILNWFNALGAKTKSIAVTVIPTPADATPATFETFSRVAANSGIPVRLSDVQGERVGQQIIVVPLRSNTNTVFLGAPDGTNNAQDIEPPAVFSAPPGKTIDAYDIYLDVSANGEGVRVVVIK